LEHDVGSLILGPADKQHEPAHVGCLGRPATHDQMTLQPGDRDNGRSVRIDVQTLHSGRGRRDRRARFAIRQGDPEVRVDREDAGHLSLPVEEERLLKIAFNVQNDRKGTLILHDQRLVPCSTGTCAARMPSRSQRTRAQERP
jgi:hypothetical protein